jgi:hypothetical protein
MTRNDLITRLVAKIVAEVPENVNLLTPGTSVMPGHEPNPSLGAIAQVLIECGEDPFHNLMDDAALPVEQAATAAERVMLACIHQTVGPLIGDVGISRLSLAGDAVTAVFDEIDAEAAHQYDEYVNQIDDDHGPVQRTRE